MANFLYRNYKTVSEALLHFKHKMVKLIGCGANGSAQHQYRVYVLFSYKSIV